VQVHDTNDMRIAQAFFAHRAWRLSASRFLLSAFLAVFVITSFALGLAETSLIAASIRAPANNFASKIAVLSHLSTAEYLVAAVSPSCL
jgi:hypothetical protein